MSRLSKSVLLEQLKARVAFIFDVKSVERFDSVNKELEFSK